MECPRCFFVKSGTVDDRRCPACGRSYRPAVNVYLGLVALVYLVFLRYMHYILTGTLFSLRPRPSWLIFDWEQFPVDILHRPALIPILGAMLALLIFVPVVVSILYGKRGGFLLAALAVLVGPNWVLGVVLMLSIWIAGGWTLRMSSKVGAAILACAPAWVFCLVVSQPTRETPLGGAYYIPTVVAIVADVLLAMVVVWPLTLLKWRARPAGIVLAAICALPVAAYQTWIGSDDIQYALYTRDVGVRSDLFADIPGKKIIEDLLADVRKEQAEEQKEHESSTSLHVPGLPDEGGDAESTTQARLVTRKIQLEIKLRASLVEQKRLVATRSFDFLARYPESRHVPDVLFTLGRALDMDMDTTLLRDSHATTAPITFRWTRVREGESRDILADVAARYRERPGNGLSAAIEGLLHKYPSSVEVWRDLLARFGESDYGAAAQVKMADYAARQGDFKAAIEGYGHVLSTFGPEADKSLPELSNLSVFTNLLDVSDRIRARRRAENVDEQVRIARRDRAFLAENLSDTPSDNEVLKAFLGIPLFEAPDQHRKTLQRLDEQCRGTCRLADNIAYELAMLEARLTGGADSAGRIAMLEDVVVKYKGTDGAAQALLALAEIETNIQSNRRAHLAKAVGYYKELLADYPGTYVARIAEQKIRVLESALLGRDGGGNGGGD